MTNVVELGEWKVKRHAVARKPNGCKHLNMTMIHDGGYVLCDDCGASLSAFFVLEMLCDRLMLELHKARQTQQNKNGAKP
ncbi:hypothetical protein [Jeongeupia sp. USM3]|uniref:hypothetical protein n=1 Tax=Jeongeupia sp. USM3 TaxID=1906741 RepID=UPI00089DE79D|nr:hypothetical protein [Jeongeupia sp. USM3]AOY00135.1 hypothetical protein BJP62_06515 [Jeongeupia sp. USM3]